MPAKGAGREGWVEGRARRGEVIRRVLDGCRGELQRGRGRKISLWSFAREGAMSSNCKNGGYDLEAELRPEVDGDIARRGRVTTRAGSLTTFR